MAMGWEGWVMVGIESYANEHLGFITQIGIGDTRHSP